MKNWVQTEGVSFNMLNEKGDISIVWGAGMFFHFKFLKRLYLGYMVLKLEYVPVMG